MLRGTSIFNVPLLLVLLIILTAVPASSQIEPFPNYFNNANFRETTIIGDYIDVDDALESLSAPLIFPLQQNQNNASLFSDGVEGPIVNFGTLSDDPRPTMWETSEYMIGKVGVYIIFVESNGELDLNLYDWSETSINWAKNGIYRALNWWKSQYPFRNPRLEFYVNVETVIGYTKYEPMLRPREDHKLWVPDVLRRLGCGDGYNYYEIGKSCAHTIRQNWKTDWAFIIFVVNSGAGFPGWDDRRAFAYINGPYVVLPFGWFYHMMLEGTDGLARVVAHEIGHIFGASDEYDGKPERSGYLYELDNDGSGCIMDSPNKWCVSRGTMRQIGWVDDNYNGYPDILENRPSIILLNSPAPVTDADEIIIEGVFKLEPYPCRRPGGRSVTINSVIPIPFNATDTLTGILLALDGLFDSAYEPFRLICKPNKPGYHTISINVMDAVMGNVESYSRSILYTYLEVQSIESLLTTKRVDVGTQIPLKFKVVLAHDKRPLESGKIFIGEFVATSLSNGWFEVIVSSDKVGRYLYHPTSAEVILNTNIGSGKLTKIELSGVKPVEIVYDRIAVSLKTMKERVDVGSEAPITIHAWYEYDGQPFVGDVILSNSKVQNVVGLYTYKAVKVVDKLYGLQTFITNEVRIIFDKVNVQLITLKERVDIGSEAPLVVKAWYEYDKMPFQGEITLNKPLIYDKVCLVTYYASQIDDKLYGLKAFETNEVQIIFDTVVVELKPINERVEVGKQAKVSYKAYYSYDGSPFEGEIFLNNDLVSYDIKQVTYSVSEITDNKYGLKSFSSNTIKVIFDKIKTSFEVNTLVPFTVKVTLKAYYESDDSPVASGVLTIGNYNLYSEKDQLGTYLVQYLEILPVTRLTGEFIVEGFNEIRVDSSVVHVGNVVAYLLIITIIIPVLIIHKKAASKRVKILTCPRCGSTKYVGVKVASNTWEYECQSCGVRWYVKKK